MTPNNEQRTPAAPPTDAAAASPPTDAGGGRGVAVRAWLRRVLPRVAIAAAALFVLRAVVRDTAFYQHTFLGGLLGLLTFLLGAATVGYYGCKSLRWLKRKLLWRVRRRLIITYLFVGLTPIVLLTGLGFIFGYGMALNMMAGSVMMQVNGTERQTRAAAHTLADALAALPPKTDQRALQTWLDERTALLQGTLPGARVAVWGAGGGSAPGGAVAAHDFDTAAPFISEPQAEQTRALGPAGAVFGAALPIWLRAQPEWSGFTFIAPPAAAAAYGGAAVCALVRHDAGAQSFVVLVNVPVNRALVERWRATTGVRLRPAFVPVPLLTDAETTGQPRAGTPPAAVGAAAPRERAWLRTDQLGEPVTETHAWVVMPATDWATGVRARHIAFLFPSALAEARRAVLERGHLGQDVRLSLVLASFAGIFFVLELLALGAAAWMTRAVTGTVHKLYRATEFIKQGDFSHRVRVPSHDQLGELAAAYNEMSANIEVLLHERVEHERLAREVEIAAEVQAQLFPRRVPELQTVTLAGECRAARGVAGDYYDFVELAPGVVALALGDVAGKGISASLVMSNLQAALRAQTTILAERLRLTERTRAVVAAAGGAAVDEPPCGVTGIDRACAVEEMVASLNAHLCQSTDANRFVTLFLALYDDHARTLRYTNAGHNAPILVRADGRTERLDVGGTIVGAFDFAHYEEAAVALAPGDLLLVFSDGISEAQNAAGEEYGEARLVQFALLHRDEPAPALRRAILTEIDQWAGGQERGDDQTIVIVKAHA